MITDDEAKKRGYRDLAAMAEAGLEKLTYEQQEYLNGLTASDLTLTIEEYSEKYIKPAMVELARRQTEEEDLENWATWAREEREWCAAHPIRNWFRELWWKIRYW